MKPYSVLARYALALAAVAAFPVQAQDSTVDMGQRIPDAASLTVRAMAPTLSSNRSARRT